MPQSPITGKFFRWQHFALVSIKFSPCIFLLSPVKSILWKEKWLFTPNYFTLHFKKCFLLFGQVCWETDVPGASWPAPVWAGEGTQGQDQEDAHEIAEWSSHHPHRHSGRVLLPQSAVHLFLLSSLDRLEARERKEYLLIFCDKCCAYLHLFILTGLVESLVVKYKSRQRRQRDLFSLSLSIIWVVGL